MDEAIRQARMALLLCIRTFNASDTAGYEHQLACCQKAIEALDAAEGGAERNIHVTMSSHDYQLAQRLAHAKGKTVTTWARQTLLRGK